MGNTGYTTEDLEVQPKIELAVKKSFLTRLVEFFKKLNKCC